MVLGFKPNFKEKILSGEKIHSLRKNNRWHAGYSIQMATGVRTKMYAQFNINKPTLQTCIATQEFTMVNEPNVDGFQVYIDGNILTIDQQKKLAKNDGFDSLEEFWSWFKINGFQKTNMITGQIIHWTNFRY